jgi:hypothetical protein
MFEFDDDIEEPRIKSIEVFDGVTSDQFLEECFALGTVAAGLAQIQAAIENCDCEKVDLATMKEEFAKDYEKMVQWLKEGKLNEVFNEIKGYVVAYKSAHSKVFAEEDQHTKLPHVLDGPLSGIIPDPSMPH